MLLSVRVGRALVLMGAFTLFGATSVGCGNTCGDGTTAANGTCTAEVAPVVICEPGTKKNNAGTACIPESVVEPDMVTNHDMVVNPDAPPARTCTDDPSICGPGTHCNANGACDPNTNAVVQVTDIQPDVLPWSIDASFTVEDGKLILYYTTVGAPAGDPSGLPDALSEQTMGRVHNTIPFSAAKWEVDADNLTFKNDPLELTEFACPNLGPELSGNGKWMTFACYRDCYGATAVGNEDICVASRADNAYGTQWTNIRFMDEISRADSVEGDPAFINDADGNPVKIIWTSNVSGVLGTNSTVVCVADFDINAAATCVQGACTGKATGVNLDGANQPICVPFQPAGPVVISDPFSSETCPAFTPDNEFFIWARLGLNTQQFDVLLGRSSNKDGVVDQYLGSFSSNTALNELGNTMAPTDGPFAGIVAWNSVPDIITLSQGSVLQLGRIDINALRTAAGGQ